MASQPQKRERVDCLCWGRGDSAWPGTCPIGKKTTDPTEKASQPAPTPCTCPVDGAEDLVSGIELANSGNTFDETFCLE